MANHTLQERYSQIVDAKLRQTHPILNSFIFNRKYEGNPKAGAVKIPVRDGEVEVGAYDKAVGKALTSGATTYITLPLDNDQAVNEIIDNHSAAAVPDDVLGDRLESAAYAIGEVQEAFYTSVLETQGDTVTNITQLDPATIYDAIVDARTQLSNNNVPEQNRYIVVSPDVYGYLLKSDHFTTPDKVAEGVLLRGALGMVAGFQVFESTVLDTNTEFIAGHNQNSHRVEEWGVGIAIEDLTNEYIGSSAVQGRKVYGGIVTKSETVLVKVYI